MTDKNERPWISVIFGNSPNYPESIILSETVLPIRGVDLKTLLAMLGHAERLADSARPGAEAEFQALKGEGLVTEEQRGQLAALIYHSQIAREIKLARRTVRRSVRRLAEKGIVTSTLLMGRHLGGHLARSTLVVFDLKQICEGEAR